MMVLFKNNIDLIIFVVAIALYCFQAAFFPLLLFSFLLLWYRREVLWRIRTENAGSKRNPFRLDKHFEIPTYIIFFVLGWIWVMFWELFMSFTFTDMEQYVAISFFFTRDIFDHTLVYLYPAHVGTEELIIESYMTYSKEFRKIEINQK